ncbi:MAG: B12-binding domain-containing radical SAM protein, partial [Anaerolineaceae bacterium]
MNVALIYPRFPDTFWTFRHALKFIGKKAVSPPLGLLTVAAMLPEDWSLRLVDANVTKLAEEDLAWADCAFVSGMTVQREPARRIIARCKEAGLLVVAGGPLFTMEYEEFDNVDHFILNEAELTLPDFLEDLEHGRAKRIYASTEFADIQTSPVPRWDLVNLSRYATMDIQYSRGCPYDCEFCNVTVLLGHMPRVKTAQQIIAELDTLYNLGWRASIFFVDDNLIGNKKHLKSELLPALIQWQKSKVGITFSTEVSINLVDDEPLMQMMVDAGFRTIFVGIETIDEESLAEANKKQNLNRDLTEEVKRFHRAGLQVRGGFI